MFERLWFTDTLKRFALDCFDQKIDTLEPSLVVLLKPQIVFPACWRELDFHSSINCLTLALPARNSPMDFISRSALAGERSK